MLVERDTKKVLNLLRTGAKYQNIRFFCFLQIWTDFNYAIERYIIKRTYEVYSEILVLLHAFTNRI